jgi:hypothetical protein
MRAPMIAIIERLAMIRKKRCPSSMRFRRSKAAEDDRVGHAGETKFPQRVIEFDQLAGFRREQGHVQVIPLHLVEDSKPRAFLG